MKLKRSIIFVIIIIMMMSCGKGDYQVGETYHGFKLIEKKFVKEVNADCYYFTHVQSGARLLKIAADDANKTFSISFKTVPESDAGTPHIMEHSVLNGSKHFPVKSPFDVLAKGSLNTFLNAMTGGDITIYPVASMNDKDFFNLMHVYLDAVFNPLIYDDPKILSQEGWHHELTSLDDPIIYKGVVYNEMKGAYSSPTRELGYHVDKNLFPDNGYRFSSGGYPSAIPTLTDEDFLNFHRKYYHPSNSYIYLYGDADLDKELAFIDQKYLSSYQVSDAKIGFPLQQPFSEIKDITAYYAVPEGSKTADQTYLTMNFVAGLGAERDMVMALQILREVLVNHESAPIRLALQEAGIGRDVRASVDDMKQNVFQITVQNANAKDKKQFKEIVYETLKDVAEKGVDKETVAGTLNRMEFRLREGDDAQKGLTYNFQAYPGWFYADDPFLSLEYEKPLAKMKEAIGKGFLEEIIRKYMLGNTHVLLLDLQPKPGLEAVNKAKMEQELADFKKSLSKEALEGLISKTQVLVDYQKREDEPEALATIPLLDLKDINPNVEWYDISEAKVNNVSLLHHETFTNDVVYTELLYNAQVLPVDLIPYAAVLAEVMGSLNTENYTYGDLDNALNLHMGGFRTYVDYYLQDRDDEKLMPKFIVSGKAMNNKVDKMFELIEEIINKSKFADKDRLKAVLTRHQSRLDANIKRNGLGYARTRMYSYFNNSGMFDELTSGVEYYWFVTDLVKNFDKKADEVTEKLAQTAQLLFSKNNLIASVTCSKNDVTAYTSGLKKFISLISTGEPEIKEWKFDFTKKNEGMLTASKVQYVLQGYNFKKLGYEWDGKMYVLNQIISRDWLTNQVRVIGGAYGGFSNFSSTGSVYFGSYRDPNLEKTFENYDGTPDYLENFEADETTMTRYIIGTIARMDRPRTPSQKGETAVRRFLENTTKENLQKDRQAVLSTTPDDLKKMKKMVADILAQEAYCVYGNEEKIESQKNLFKTTFHLSN